MAQITPPRGVNQTKYNNPDFNQAYKMNPNQNSSFNNCFDNHNQK